MRKVLDIWVKGSTFPISTLERLKFRLSPSQPPSAPGSSRSPGYANIGAYGSTTPTGSPSAAARAQFAPPAPLDPNDGYAGYGANGNGASNGSGPGESLSPTDCCGLRVPASAVCLPSVSILPFYWYVLRHARPAWCHPPPQALRDSPEARSYRHRLTSALTRSGRSCISSFTQPSAVRVGKRSWPGHRRWCSFAHLWRFWPAERTRPDKKTPLACISLARATYAAPNRYRGISREANRIGVQLVHVKRGGGRGDRRQSRRAGFWGGRRYGTGGD
jgi:hypothetical protein